MNNKSQNNKIKPDFDKFIDYRRQLNSFDKKLEAAKLIEQIKMVDVDNAYQSVAENINRSVPKYNLLTAITRIAAVFTLPLLAFTIWTLFFQDKKDASVESVQNDITWQEISSPMGMRSQVVLPDGTHLWLNAGSKLRYSIPFVRDRRLVELTGEAFLDVKKDEESPFVVKAGEAEVEVVGTQFNANAWPQSETIEIALKEGSVKFKFQAEEGISKFVQLKPNDYLQFGKDKKSVLLENTNINKYIAWHQNIMILEDTPMVKLAQLLEQWYGIRVVIANEEIKRYRFTTTFVNEPLHRVLELLEISSPGIKINYTMGKPIDGTKEFSASVVTISKK